MVESKALEYLQLRKAKRYLDKRLEVLKEELKIEIEAGRVTNLKIQQRDLTTFNEARVNEVMLVNNIDVDDYTTRCIDPSAIETMYYEGTITDTDLRYMREPKYSYVLVPSYEGGDSDIQEQDDSVSEGL